MNSKKRKAIICLVIGDSEVGKSSLVVSCNTNEFQAKYAQNYPITVKNCTVSYALNLIDVLGEKYTTYISRDSLYKKADVFLVCFSTVKPNSFYNVNEMVPKIFHYYDEKPVLLVGTHIDLRDDKLYIDKLKKYGQSPITKKMGEKMSKELNAYKYLECSCITQEGLNNVFDEAILAALPNHELPKKKRCSLL